MDGVKKRKLNQRFLVGAVEQIEIGGENENIAFNIVRKLQFMRLSRRHEENTGWPDFVFVAVNHMIS